MPDTPIIPADDMEAGGPDARRCEAASLLKLLAWLSPAFPVGSFSYSHGLEAVIEAGAVRTESELHAWIEDLVTHGSGWTDAVLLAHAWRAVRSGDRGALLDLAALASALAPSRERHVETVQQGAAFLDAVAAAWPLRMAAGLRRQGDAPYPVAVGAVGADHGLALAPVLLAWTNAFAGNLVSVAVRLVPLGQSAGLRTLSALHPALARIGSQAAVATLDDLGSATVLSDIAAMRHEVQYSRVFRT